MGVTNGILDARQLDPEDQTFTHLLDNVQGNILKGHGRDHSVHLFLRFATGDKVRASKAITELTGYVTSMRQQLEDTSLFKQFGIPGGLFGSLALSASAYRKLGLALPSTDLFYVEGMNAKAGQLNDSPESLDPPYRAGDIDVVLLLADDGRDFLLRTVRSLLAKLSAMGLTLVAAEIGDVLRNSAEEGIEHFGYVDGRSQPLYLKGDVDAEIDRRTGADIDKSKPAEPLRLVLVPDPLVPDAADACGSLMVFRKLEQNVQAFKMREQELANALQLEGEDRERAGAMVVGRFEDGTPLALSQVDGLIPKKENNFDYSGDPDGLKCPFQAHIRKTNPRGDTVRKFGVPDEAERSHRITRRGIPYGVDLHKPNDDLTLSELPTGGVGLLFVCFQASIADQFAFMQQSWANSEGFLQGGVGIDPVIGQTLPPHATVSGQTWNPIYGAQSAAHAPVRFDFGRFVTFKGGEFFFAPSMPFLKGIEALVSPPKPVPAPVSPPKPSPAPLPPTPPVITAPSVVPPKPTPAKPPY